MISKTERFCVLSAFFCSYGCLCISCYYCCCFGSPRYFLFLSFCYCLHNILFFFLFLDVKVLTFLFIYFVPLYFLLNNNAVGKGVYARRSSLYAFYWCETRGSTRITILILCYIYCSDLDLIIVEITFSYVVIDIVQ